MPTLNHAPTEQFLATAEPREIAGRLGAMNPSNKNKMCTRRDLMAWVQHNRPKAYPEVLAQYFGITVREEQAAGRRGAKASLGYVPVPQENDFADAPKVPLIADTPEQAYLLACNVFDLADLYEQECDAEMAVPRRCVRPPKQLAPLMSYIVAQVRTFEPLNTAELGFKLAEETGEFGKAILIEQGRLPHKTLDEPAMGEAADIFNCVLGMLAKHYPNQSPEQLVEELTQWMGRKQGKYDRILLAKAPQSVSPVGVAMPDCE